MNIEVAI